MNRLPQIAQTKLSSRAGMPLSAWWRAGVLFNSAADESARSTNQIKQRSIGLSGCRRSPLLQLAYIRSHPERSWTGLYESAPNS